jgi:putative heme-binding domain-containing protein
VNTPAADTAANVNTGGILEKLARQPRTATDPLLPFMIWLAGEPKVAGDPPAVFNFFAEHGHEMLTVACQMIYKTMRRVCDLQEPAHLDAAADFLTQLPLDGPLLSFALNGLVDGQKGKAIAPAKPTDELFKKLLASPRANTVGYARQLGALWGNASSIAASVSLVNDAKATVDERVKAIQAVRQLKNETARDAVLKVISPNNPEPLVLEAIRALSEIGGDAVSGELISRWKNSSPAVRRASAEALASRDRWASALLSALERKEIQPGEIPATTIRTLTRSQADYGMLAKRAIQVFGKVRDADKDKLKIIAAKKQMILREPSPPDLKAGHDVAAKTCLTCHKLHDEGADIGPDLTGVGRSTLDALLANVIDPNQIIGAGYENVEVTTKDERSISGRMVENTDVRVRLLSAGPKEDVIAKSDIANIRVSELSVMPEGLEQMPDAEFRNLIGYILNPPGDNQPFSWKNDEGGATGRGTGVAPMQVPKKSAGVTTK